MTYDTSHINITKKGNLSLSKRHLQLFWKRLRKITPKAAGTLKYYAVGEYGGRFKRPHYHAIVFNAVPELMDQAWAHYNRKTRRYKTIGSIYYGTVTGASIAYTLKYISKLSVVDKRNKSDDRQREFSIMSKGLGKNYITPEMIAWHKADLLNRMYVNLEGGQKAAMPRYYKDKIYTAEERCQVGGYQSDILFDKEFKFLEENIMLWRERSEVFKASVRKQLQIN